MMEASRIRKGMVVECQQGVGTIMVVDQESETVLLAKQGSEEQLAVSFDEIEDNPQLHGNCEQYY
jgi:translation elongation factor P/translation initiation factor 5A